MPRCGDCENYRWSYFVSEGSCNAIRLSETRYKQVKYRDDASKCDKFIPLTRVVTDAAQSGHLHDQHIRPYDDHELQKIDVQVDPEKLKEERYWG